MKGVSLLIENQKKVPHNHTVEHLAQSIFIVNRHAKTAPNPKYLYKLKHEAIKKMLLEKKATKVGLHYSLNPKFSQQQSDVLVKCGRFTFHTPPSKDDFKQLPHLGKLNNHVRNPKVTLSLNVAKKTLEHYVNLKEDKNDNYKNQKKIYNKHVFKPLGESYF